MTPISRDPICDTPSNFHPRNLQNMFSGNERNIDNGNSFSFYAPSVTPSPVNIRSPYLFRPRDN
jgi:hypothetical protein